MTVEIVLTGLVLVAVLGMLIREVAAPPLVVMGGVIALLLTDVITAEQAFAGFSNPAPITVAALYVVARAAQRTGIVGVLTRGVLGADPDPQRTWSAGARRLLRLMVPTAGASAFFNNTPIVAMVAPAVSSWAAARGESPSRLLMPVSFAAILGGTLTAVGTSTTLVVSGLMQQAGMEAIGLFEPLAIAGPVVIVGTAVVVLAGPRLLPDRRDAYGVFENRQREFTVCLVVDAAGPVATRTLAEAGLRSLVGVYCVRVVRGDQVLAPVAPDLVLHGGDEMTFVGDLTKLVDLQEQRGLTLAEADQASRVTGDGQQFYEAVIGTNSPLVGRTLKETSFRARFGAAVVAIHRSGEPVADKLGQVGLRAGDTLLCLADGSFARRWEETGAFALVGAVGAAPPLDVRRTRTTILVLVVMLVTAGFGVLSILEAALLAAAVLLVTRVMTTAEARVAIDLPVIVVIAGAFGLGSAVEESGLAALLADGLLAVAAPFGTAGLVIALLVLTMILTEAITNNAAAALAFPIVLASAQAAGLDPRPLVLAVAIAASLSFVTPLGYQTNLMVYGLGGYRFSDFAKVGGPVAVATLITLSLTTLATV